MDKYYITNGDQYVANTGNGSLLIGGPISQAKRFRIEGAENTLKYLTPKYPEYCIQKYYSSSSNKNYVLTNANKFVGDNNTIVNQAQKARTFKTAADADGYIRSRSDILVNLGKPIIVNQNYETVDIFGHKKLCRNNFIKVNTEVEKTPRVGLPKAIRYQIFERDKGICQICGKPLTIDKFTIDHIVPLQRGGLNKLSNYRCVCERCNKWKSDSLDEELINMMEDVGTNYLYKNPMSDTARKVMRSIIRGCIYGNKPLYESKMNLIKMR